MNLEELRTYCLAKHAVSEHFPFDDRTLVFKVGGKIFLLVDIHEPFTFNVKCNPERAVELREAHEEITGGFHMDKKHWNTIDMTGRLSHAMIRAHIDHSYEEVVKGLPKKVRLSLFPE